MPFIESIPIFYNIFQRKLHVMEVTAEGRQNRRCNRKTIHSGDIKRELAKRRFVRNPEFGYKHLQRHHAAINGDGMGRSLRSFLFPDGQHFEILVPLDAYNCALPPPDSFFDRSDVIPYYLYIILYHNNFLSEANKRYYRLYFYALTTTNSIKHKLQDTGPKMPMGLINREVVLQDMVFPHPAAGQRRRRRAEPVLLNALPPQELPIETMRA